MVGVLSRTGRDEPSGTNFMILFVAFERFAFYGALVILVMYMRQILKYSEDSSVLIFHLFSMVGTILPVLGVLLGETICGKYLLLLLMSLLHAAGLILMTYTSTLSEKDTIWLFTMIALSMIFIGSGLSKPSFVGFGGEQFVLIQHENLMIEFFTNIYIAMNVATLLAKWATPTLRQDYECHDRTTCYKLPFAACSIAMLLAALSLAIGCRYYKRNLPKRGIFIKVSKCIWLGIRRRWQTKQKHEKHWLYLTEDKYDTLTIRETRTMLNMLYMFLPMPIYWALFLQLHSRWIIQATHMDGDLGFYMLKPDHMPFFSPFVVILCVPLFNFISPCFKSIFFCKTPLQKMAIGGFLTAAAFFMAGFVQLKLESSSPEIPGPGYAHIRMFNGFECASVVRIPTILNEGLDHFDMWELLYIEASGTMNYPNTTVTLSEDCRREREFWNDVLIVVEKKIISYLITFNSNETSVDVVRVSEEDDVERSLEAKAKIRVLYKFIGTYRPVYMAFLNPKGKVKVDSHLWPESVQEGPWELYPNRYTVQLNQTKLTEVQLDDGAIYTLLIQENVEVGNIRSELFTITPQRSLHMLWQIPQIFFLTIGDMLVNFSAMEFSFSQISPAMKSIIQALWGICLAFGNVIIMCSVLIPLLSPTWEYFFFGIIMVLDMILFSLWARNYTFINYADDPVDASAVDPTTTASDSIPKT